MTSPEHERWRKRPSPSPTSRHCWRSGAAHRRHGLVGRSLGEPIPAEYGDMIAHELRQTTALMALMTVDVWQATDRVTESDYIVRTRTDIR